MPKQLYKGIFNWCGEVHTLYRKAHHLEHAKKELLLALSKKLNMTSYAVRQYFDGSRDNFKIELEGKKGEK